MAKAVITLRPVRRGKRVDELLSAVARRLDRDGLQPDDSGLITLRFDDRGPRAWDAVRDALDASGADWRQWLYLAPRPSR